MIFVIKVGTNVLTNDSYKIQDKKIAEVVGQIGLLMKKGHKVVLVSSGAVGSGRASRPDLGLTQKKQMWAAIGQPILMSRYNYFAKKKGLVTAQCLVLRHDFSEKERRHNFVSTIDGLLKSGVLPIINENDVMATEDLTVGDNDLLSATVAMTVKADKLILLTNQKGFFTSNPDEDASAKLIEVVPYKKSDAELEKFCCGGNSTHGRGGMLSKIRAARIATSAGIETYIIDGRERDIITKLVSGKKVGTHFLVKK